VKISYFQLTAHGNCCNAAVGLLCILVYYAPSLQWIKPHENDAHRLENFSIAAICGKGDNAGDALAMLRHAKMGGCNQLTAYIPALDTMKENAVRNVKRAQRCGIAIVEYRSDRLDDLRASIAEYDIIFDALLGTGIQGQAKADIARVIDLINGISTSREDYSQQRPKKPLVVSIDVPSGIGDMWQQGYPCIAADVTLCITPIKQALFIPEVRRFCW